MTMTNYFCSELSTAAAEQLGGSAPHRTTWFLLEYGRPWGAKAFEESSLDEPIKQHIRQALDQIPTANILLIKQSEPQRTGIRFYIANTHADAPELYAYTLNSYQDLLSIDLVHPAAEHRTAEPLYLICTNGKRDQCCSKFGLGVYRAAQQQVGPQAWQCSHLGGHRFAATALFLPSGLCYGRLTPASIGEVLGCDQAGDIHLPTLRGRVGYPQPLQAAEYLLRDSLHVTAHDAVKVVSAQESASNSWDVDVLVNHAMQNVRLEKTETDVEILTSCFQDKRERLTEYALVAAGS
jgi:hypothetical protein